MAKRIRFISLISVIGLFSSCTLSMNMIETHGEATDVIDSTQSPNVKADPKVSLPIYTLRF